MNTISRLNEKFSLKQILVTSFLVLALPLASVVIAHDGDKSPNATNQEMNKGGHCEHGGEVHHGMGDREMGKPGMPPYLRGLQLSTAQEDQIFALTYPQIPTMRDQHKQHMQLMDELRTATQADKFDEAKVQQLADKIANLEKEKIVTSARNDAKIFAILTPEQRVKAREAKMHRHGFEGDHGFGPDAEHRHEHDADHSDADNANFKQTSNSPLIQRVI